MSPREIYDEMALNFPGVWPQDPAHEWESLCVGQSASVERIADLLARHMSDAELVVLVHSNPGVGAILPRSDAVGFVVAHFLQADIQVANRDFTSFVEISKIGVGTGWQKDAHA
jgi:hypothetical protein